MCACYEITKIICSREILNVGIKAFWETNINFINRKRRREALTPKLIHLNPLANLLHVLAQITIDENIIGAKKFEII